MRAIRRQTALDLKTVSTIETFAPDLNCFRRGKDFAAWLGLVPKQNSTGGKPRLGTTSKMGQRDIRRLLISGAMAVLQAVERFGTPHNSWLISILERKPRMLVAVSLANKMARGLWAMVTKQVDYRTPATMACAQCDRHQDPGLERVRRSMNSKGK